MTELWIQTALAPVREIAAQAARLETDGWGGVMLFDSQCLIADPYVALALAAAATTRMGLGIGVTNPITRHAAVTASAIAAVQEASGGRAVLGIGRGNSSLAFLGARPASPASFEAYVGLLQTLLRGEGAPVEQLLARGDGLAALDPQSLGRAPDAARLAWLDRSAAKVPVEIAATGPKLIAIAARKADRLSISVGAEVGRIADTLATARAAIEAAGRSGPLPVTAYVALACLDDAAAARRLVAPDVAMHAHIAAMSPDNLAAMSDEERAVTKAVAAAYDMTRHARHGAQTEALDDAFIDAHAIVGPARACVERLKALADLGLGRIVLMLPPPLKGDPRASYEAIVGEVLPAFAAPQSR